MLSDGPAFIVALVALLIGTAAGFLVQRVAVALRYNGAWGDTPTWKKWSLSGTGSIAAFAAGAYILSNAPSFSPEEVLARMWLWQTLAAWAGPTALDVGVEWLRKGGKK